MPSSETTIKREDCANSPYKSIVPQNPLGADTSPEIERLQIDKWRLMSPDQKAAIVSGLTRGAMDSFQNEVKSARNF